ncbi:Hypothetical protein CINCED_3A018712 [Cinara cedri]|uniref:Nucleophile aminohydrolases, N-terminal,Gamma-glutamyltranspeptidase n=1 Tax=Cinara cedri TaxID=506608 RepID=A0A5E4MT12_9HEMI|nr:Hypothetical protein CINCED_3A018712 [Cinara cedri]
MGKNHYGEEFNDNNDWSMDITEKTLILGNQQKKKIRSLSKSRLFCIGIVILTTIVTAAIVYSQYVYVKPDPEFPLPPPKMRMGVYKHVGVVSQGEQCPQIGVDVISKGGNAVDAAIAVMLCDGVLGLQNMGIGGGFIMSIYNSTTKKVTSVNARVVAPLAATSDMFIKEKKETLYGGLPVAVPGEVKGYAKIYELFGGGVSWESLFQPAIDLCEKGMTISRHLGVSLRARENSFIQYDPLFREVFFDEKTGHAKKKGETYKLLRLAKTLRVIAKEGADAIYNGSLTPLILDDLNKVNGIITKEDLANFQVEVEEAFSVKLKNGYSIHTGSPPGSGIILAFILRVLDGLLPAPNAALDAHRLVEAFKYGYAERTHLGDHRFVNITQIFDKVKSDSYIDSIRRKIADNFTSLDPSYYGADFDVPEDHGTANSVIYDSQGNAVVVTSTINTIFGSGFMSPNTGIIFNSEMDSFSAPGHVSFYKFPASPANFIEPGKRPMSSMSPTIFTDENDDFILGVGAAGGSKITQASSYAAALKFWYNKTLKESLDKPRIYHQLMPMEIQYEYGMTRDVVQQLKDIGHPMARLKYPGVSSATAICKSPLGMIEVMPDSRRPGNTSGY